VLDRLPHGGHALDGAEVREDEVRPRLQLPFDLDVPGHCVALLTTPDPPAPVSDDGRAPR
jgi:hypothetical protein